MLGDVRTRARRDQRRDRGEVERAAPIAAGAAGIDQRVARLDVERRDALAHRHRRAGDLVSGLAFHA